MLRQKRTTVGLLTWARSASSRTGRWAKVRGSLSTSRATRCSAGASEGREAVMRSSMGAGAWGLRAKECNAVSCAGAAYTHRLAHSTPDNEDPHEPTRRTQAIHHRGGRHRRLQAARAVPAARRHHQPLADPQGGTKERSEEHTSELQSPLNLVCRLLLEKKK